MSKKETITVQGTEITVIQKNKDDYISLTDMAGYKDTLDARIVVSNWMSSRYTLEFLGIWEQVNNPDFNYTEFGTIKNEGGSSIIPILNLSNSAGLEMKSPAAFKVVEFDRFYSINPTFMRGLKTNAI